MSDYPRLIASSFLKSSPQQRREEQRRRARTDLYYLLRFICKRADVEKQWLFDRCREVQADPDYRLDLWAREHYKSTIITFGLTLQDILASHGDDPIISKELTIGIFSHTRPMAKSFLKQIKRELETNTILKDLFPDILYENPAKESPKWSEDEGLIVKRKSNPKECTIEAWGVVDGQPIGKHFDRLIYDDVVTRETVNTPDMIAKTMEMLELSYALGAEGGTMRFIGTRYHFNDPYRTVMARGTAIPRIYPATHDGTDTGDSVLLDPETLRKKRRNMGPYTFACQMLQNPKGDKSQGFDDAWRKTYKSVNRDGLNVYILMDPANGKKKDNDYTAGWVVGLGADEKIRILDIVRDRLNLAERTRLLFRWHRTFKPVRRGVRYEKYGKDADIDHIEGEMEAQNYEFEIDAVGGSTSKPDRIKRLIPYFEQGRILFPEKLFKTNYEGETEDLVDVFFEQEFKAFPVPVHDDMLDALARLFEPDLPLVWPKEETIQEDIPPGYAGPTAWMA